MRKHVRCVVAAAVLLVAGGVFVPGGAAQAASCRIDHTLRHKQWGDQVLCLERALWQRGYLNTNIDIYFGTFTQDAVADFKADHGLSHDGVVGRSTAQALGIWARRAVPPHHPIASRLVGRTVNGLAIRAYRYGNGRGKVAVAMGQIHGNEPGGAMIAAYLRNHGSIPGVDLWVLDTVNPDGWRRQMRTNLHGVDINRNFAAGNWVYSGKGTNQYSGPFAASEPETQATQRFLRDVHPRVMIVWHQVGRHVDDNQSVANRPLLKQYAALVNFPIRTTSSCRRCGGTATAFVNNRLNGTAFTVEMPATFSFKEARRHGNAFLQIAAAS